jgi:hypothetical protein
MSFYLDKTLERIVAGILATILAGLVLYMIASRKQNGRFVPVPGAPTMAVDSRTGQLCYTFDPLGEGSARIPLCKNIK